MAAFEEIIKRLEDLRIGGEQNVLQYRTNTNTIVNPNIVPFVIRKGRLPPHLFSNLLQIWTPEMNRQGEPQENNPGQCEFFYRFDDRFRKIRAQATNYNMPMPAQAKMFHRNFLDRNEAVFEFLEANCNDMTFPCEGNIHSVWNHAPKGARPHNLRDCVLNLPCLQKRWQGGSTIWHCDGGASLLFLNITLEGERILDIEYDDPDTGEIRRRQFHLYPGDFYISSPAVFWHRVHPVPGVETCTSLIYRSSVLLRRTSGGREKENGTRTRGWRFETQEVFCALSTQIADLLHRTSLVWRLG